MSAAASLSSGPSCCASPSSDEPSMDESAPASEPGGPPISSSSEAAVRPHPHKATTARMAATRGVETDDVVMRKPVESTRYHRYAAVVPGYLHATRGARTASREGRGAAVPGPVEAGERGEHARFAGAICGKIRGRPCVHHRQRGTAPSGDHVSRPTVARPRIRTFRRRQQHRRPRSGSRLPTQTTRRPTLHRQTRAAIRPRPRRRPPRRAKCPTPGTCAA